MNVNLKSKWWLDVVLFATFLGAFFLNLTGLALHQWIGLAGGLLAVYHLGTRWTWVKTVGARFFGRTSSQARLYYLVDASLLVGFGLIVSTGLVISSWLNLSLANYSAWSNLHTGASIVTLLVLILKLGLHGRWIVSAVHKVFAGAPIAFAQRPATPARAVSRREFLKVMGVLGAASVFALGNSFRGLQDSIQTVQADPTAVETTTSSAQMTAADNTATLSQTSTASQAVSSACVVRCSRGCSFPGRCRRYTDSNANQRCDMAECL